MNAGVSFEKEKVKESQSQSRNVTPSLDTPIGCRVGGVTVVDLLTKSTHFLPVRTDYSLDKLVEVYIMEIVQLYEIPILIISDRDPRFTSRFWGKLREAFGT